VGLDALYGAMDRFHLDLADFATITSRPEGGSIHLPFTVNDGLTVDADAEQEMLRLVNAERQRAGLPALRLDPTLTAVARAQSEEMFRLGYFSHVSPVHGDPSDRLAAAGAKYLVAGENLAYAPNVEIAHHGLMNSPGHRANILRPEFGRVGIGVIRSQAQGSMFSQEFTN
jgi:uncharacterized protein YkwD